MRKCCNLAVFLALVVSTLVAPADARSLIQLSFLHRHGARQPPEVDRGRISWEHAELTPAGAQMAHNMGKFFRQRYADFFPANYSQQFIYSRSTDVARTIQSGYGFLRGLFGEADRFSIPFLEHKPLSSDFALAFNDNWPSHELLESHFYAWPHTASLADSVLNASDVAALAEAMGGDAWCTQDPLFCALVAEDVAQCERSNSGLSPLLSQLWEKLVTLQMMLNKFVLGFHANSTLAPAGSYAWVALNEWMTRSSAAVQATAPSGPATTDPPVLHLSAHDDQVVAMLNALGVANLSTYDTHMWVPKFFDTLICETYDDGSVSFFKAKPDEGFGTEFPISIEQLAVLCVNATTGSVYASTACPVVDAWLYLNRTAPAYFPPQCFVPAEDLRKYNCSELDAAPAPGSNCALYRAGCPATACDNVPTSGATSSVLDIANGYACDSFVVPPSFARELPIYLSGVAAAVLLGCVVGAFIDALLRRTAGETMVHESDLQPDEDSPYRRMD